jgi:hypothetical protein
MAKQMKKAVPAHVVKTQTWTKTGQAVQDKVADFTPLNVSQGSMNPNVLDHTPKAEDESSEL